MSEKVAQAHTALCLLQLAQGLLSRAELESYDHVLTKFVASTNRSIDTQINRQLRRYEAALEKKR